MVKGVLAWSVALASTTKRTPRASTLNNATVVMHAMSMTISVSASWRSKRRPGKPQLVARVRHRRHATQVTSATYNGRQSTMHGYGRPVRVTLRSGQPDETTGYGSGLAGCLFVT